jgi:hypothetical protein
VSDKTDDIRTEHGRRVKRSRLETGLVTFYDTEHDFGVDVWEGRFSVSVRGSSELRGMSEERAAALADMLSLAVNEARWDDLYGPE